MDFIFTHSIELLRFFLVLSVLVLIHEFGHFITAKRSGVHVEEFGLGLPPRVFGKKIGDTLYSLNALPFGGFVKLFGEEEAELAGKKLSEKEKERSFTHKSTFQKSLIICAGVICNFLLGWGIMTYLFTQGVPVPSTAVKIESLADKSPAQEARLMVGDQILSYTRNGSTTKVTSSDEFITVAKKYAGEPLELSIKRGNEIISTTLIPRKNPPKGQGALGISISNYEIKKYSLSEAPILGLQESGRMTYAIASGVVDMVVKGVTLQKNQADVIGPVGIYIVTNKAAENGFNSLLQLMGLLSLNLAVVNILPFPALDGGRLVMILYEGITRRKINIHLQYKLNTIGFIILIGLLVLLSFHDLTHLDILKAKLR